MGIKNNDRNEIEEKLELVINKLMNLGCETKDDEELAKKGEAVGFFKRDFGIKEWDWLLH